MRRQPRYLPLLVVASVVALIFTACGSAAPAPSAAPKNSASTAPQSSAPAKPKEMLSLKVASPHPGQPETGLVAIAQAKGFFKEEGVEPELVLTKGGGDTIQAVVSGGADVGLNNGPMGILGAIEKGADIKIISAGVTPASQWWIAAGDSPYKTIKDLEGKKIGYTSQGSSTDMFLTAILEKEGVKAEKVAAGDLGGQWTQVKTGQLAAAPAVPPDSWRLVEKEGARKIFATTDYPEFAEYTYVVHFARSDSIKNKPEAIKAFLRGMKKAADFIKSDPAGATKVYMPNTELPEDLVLRYFKEAPPTLFRLAPIGGMDITIKYAKQFKFISKDPDPNAVVDLSLVPK